MVGQQPLRWRVAEVVAESADASSFVLEAEAGAEIAYRPGQFLTVRVPSLLTGSAARSYSLSSAPGLGEPMRITVKRTAEGYVSNWMCDNLRAGDVLETLRPAGVFTPSTLDDDLLLVSAGSGITPVLSILKAALSGGSARVALFYANRDETSVVFAAELRAMQEQYGDRLAIHHWLESIQSVPTAAALCSALAPYVGRETFICGPGPFMDLAVSVLAGLGARADAVHVEKFVSLSGDPFAEQEPAVDGPVSIVEVALDGQAHELAWPENRVLLDVLLDAGLDAPYSCREGACSACSCLLVDGQLKMDRNEVLDEADLADGIVLACQARPVSNRIRVSYDA